MQLICYPHNILWHIFQLSKICGMTKMVNKQKKLEFSLATPRMNALFICDLANVVHSREGHSIVKLNTTCEQSLLPLYYMP